MEDGRCKLGLAGGLAVVGLLAGGWWGRAAAAPPNVAPATAHRWWHRWRSASDQERASRSCLRARSPVPRSCPWALSQDAEQRILRARAQTNLGPARLAGLVGYRRSTRSCDATAAPSVGARSLARRRDGSSGLSPERCCISTRCSFLVLMRLGIGRPVIAPGIARGVRAPSTSFRSSTTTPAWPTASCIAPRTASRPRRRSSARRPG